MRPVNNKTTWAKTLLKRLSIPESHGAVKALVGWANAEGGHWSNSARYNPLNTTLRMHGSSVMGGGNTAGVQSYQSWHQGLKATAKTLSNYPGVLQALRSGNSQAVAQAVGSSPWGTPGGLLSSAIASAKVGHGYVAGGGGGGGRNGGGSMRQPSLGGMGQQTVNTGMSNQAFDQGRRSLLLNYVDQQNTPDGLLNLALGMRSLIGQQQQQATTTPGVPLTRQVPLQSGLSGGTSSSGAAAAVRYAYKHLGIRETGVNSGPYISGLEHRFGFSNAPWCTMFTSAAVTHGGAPASARTAAVKDVRTKAAAHQGYVGFVNHGKGRAGDLILFGNDHIGMIVGRTKGGYVMIAGNDGNAVSKRVVAVGSGDIVRPAYGQNRKRK